MKRLTPKRRPSKTTKVARREHPAVARPRSSSAVNLQKQLDQRTRELAEAQKRLAEAFEQQTTTSEILGVIAHSATDVQPVLDTVCQSAARLCEAYDSTIWRPDGDQSCPLPIMVQLLRSNLSRWSAGQLPAELFSISAPCILLTCRPRCTNFPKPANPHGA